MPPGAGLRGWRWYECSWAGFGVSRTEEGTGAGRAGGSGGTWLDRGARDGRTHSLKGK